ncbi:alpha-L-glutamate ligase [Streptomyces benahoarensis]|uniref:Alpha-L-glutamate ligase n=1 Tax=Streptomyces benahoarensis TaxID=2595054 RepID=A0A553YC13_9ACTN|nr:alpha-L-glutamate ligase [Streptomyces benahoarensis]TSB15700.1 alpha-L-glutamate ligase [Streptomyces benahoarensis]TSB26739.1 alpha-L-glutamate ligase [Streptomyces benahoarensis]
MRVCLLTDKPGHPLLVAASALLAERGTVVAYDPDAEAVPVPVPAPVPAPAPVPVPAPVLVPDEGGARPGASEGAKVNGEVPVAAGVPAADVYLLKAHTPRALALAARLAKGGAAVVNSAAATALCQDRTEMAAVARAAGLPFAATRTLDRLGPLAAAGEPSVPLVVKSRRSRRGDLVARADTAADLRALAAAWPDEPVVVQEFTPNGGWDHKLWAIDGQLFAAVRRSELAPGGRGGTTTVDLAELPAGWAELVHRVGEVFALDVYGVDLLDAGDGTPVIVDINAFPGVRGQAGAPEALAALALRAAAGARAVRAPGRAARGPATTGTRPSSATADARARHG